MDSYPTPHGTASDSDSSPDSPLLTPPGSSSGLPLRTPQTVVRRKTPRPQPRSATRRRGLSASTTSMRGSTTPLNRSFHSTTSSTSSSRRRSRPTTPTTPSAASSVTGGVSTLLVDTFSNLFWLLRKPLSWLLSLYLLLFLLNTAYTYTRSTFTRALTPLCALPLPLPFCTPPHPPSNFPELINLQGSFEGVLENSLGGSYLALDLKNSEMAVRDLNNLVRASHLNCKEDLSQRLDEFITSAKDTSRHLTKFSARVAGAVDSLLAMDTYALRALEDLAALEAAEHSGKHGLLNTVLAPIRPPRTDIALATRTVYNTFVRASSIMDSSLRRLILEATSLIGLLESLDDRLGTIGRLAQTEHAVVLDARAEVLAQIWTFLGGNRDRLANLDGNADLLRNVGLYRNKALAHVTASLMLMQQMEADLGELREKVAQPGLLGVGGEVPLSVQVDSIRRGVERLGEGMKRARGKQREGVERMLGEAERGEGVWGALGLDARK